MKIIAPFFIAFIALFVFFAGQKHTSTTVSHNTSNTSITSNVGVANGQGQCHAKQVDPNDPQSYLPDQNCTPGVINPDVTQANIDSTICVAGFTKTIRPPASYTGKLKRQQIQEYGYTDTNSRDYEEDHFISLELGGSPTDPKNLWPEPHPSTNEKDKVEDYLHKQVCDGKLTLAQVQSEITQNWYAVYQQIK
jgi:hypothetical protein